MGCHQSKLDHMEDSLRVQMSGPHHRGKPDKEKAALIEKINALNAQEKQRQQQDETPETATQE